MIFLAPGIVILSQVFGVTVMLWAAPAADVLAFGLTVILVVPEWHSIRTRANRSETSKPETRPLPACGTQAVFPAGEE